MVIARNENLSMTNQDQRTVEFLKWNKRYKKLLSLDGSGLMIVWVEHKGKIVQEMINQSEQDRIKLVTWSRNDTLIILVL